MNHSALPLPDQNQNYWQMASIQSAAFGVPTLMVGIRLGQLYGPGVSIVSICIGNLILWIIGLATIAMTVEERKNAIENLQNYIGRLGCILGGITLSFAFLFWYSLQLSDTVSSMRTVLSNYIQVNDAFNLRLGAAFGIIIALISMGGIKLIKYVNTCAFPFLIAVIVFCVLKNPSMPVLTGTWGLSIPAIIWTLVIALPAIVNIPTFFRHRRSSTEAFLALSLFVFFTSIIEILAIFLANKDTGKIFVFSSQINVFYFVIVVFFICVSLLCANLVNIYYASAVWEKITPWASRSKEFGIIGLSGTVVFTFLQSRIIMVYLENIASGFIANLGIVIIIGFLVQTIVVHRQRSYELAIAFLCWVAGCITTVVIQKVHQPDPIWAFMGGISASILAFTVVLFIEETVWCYLEHWKKKRA